MESTFPTHVLAATDGSPRAQGAVDFAAKMAACFGAKLSLIHVLAPGETAPAGLKEQGQRAGAEIEIIESDKPADAICERAEDIGADAIVVGNVGMSDRKEFLLGNVPNRVSHRARCTVIIVNTGNYRAKKETKKDKLWRR